MPTVTARELYFDGGESLDVYQVVGPGGVIQSAQQVNGQTYGNKVGQDNITAHAGGGQSAAVQITALQARITIVANANDSVILPPSFRGMSIILLNDAASNACNVYPAVGEQINAAGVNVPFSLPAQNGTGTSGTTIFYCFTAGSWRTK
jgi:hypothetical protein